MTAIIQKWGGHLALCLPKTLGDEARITEGAEVELVRTEEGLLLKSAGPRRYRLSELIAGITSENVHPPMEWGPSVGREIVE